MKEEVVSSTSVEAVVVLVWMQWRWPQNKGGWVLGRGGPNKLFPQKNVLPEMAQEEKKKVKQNIFLAHIQNPSQMF